MIWVEMSKRGWAVTEEEFETCEDPLAMLDYLRDMGSEKERRFRLFSSACVRGLWPSLADARCRVLVEVIERFGEGGSDGRELNAAWVSCNGIAGEAARAARAAAAQALTVTATAKNVVRATLWATEVSARAATARAQCHLLRDIFRPFRPQPSLDTSLLSRDGGLIARLAQAAYDERALPLGTLDNSRLTVLADALEEAGLTD
jgi:hypothetical protein